jgi:hypothetical protein
MQQRRRHIFLNPARTKTNRITDWIWDGVGVRSFGRRREGAWAWDFSRRIRRPLIHFLDHHDLVTWPILLCKTIREGRARRGLVYELLSYTSLHFQANQPVSARISHPWNSIFLSQQISHTNQYQPENEPSNRVNIYGNLFLEKYSPSDKKYTMFMTSPLLYVTDFLATEKLSLVSFHCYFNCTN